MSAANQSDPIVNEVLAFLQEKLLLEGRMDTVSAIQICSSSFTVDDICAAKKVLFESLGIVGTYVPHRRGDTAGKKTLEDIIDILRENEQVMPEFVATGVSRLPSYIPDHVDVGCLLKDIVALKASLAEILTKFEASQATITELRNEVNSLRNSAPVSRSQASNFKCNDCLGTSVNVSASSVESVSLRVADTARVAAAAPPPACPPRARPPPASSKSRHRYADVVAGQPVAVNRRSAPSRVPEAGVPPKEKPPRTDMDKEGFTLVSSKRKLRKSQCGTAEPVGSGLRVATPSKALYVSRLHYSATADDLVQYIHQKTGYSLRVFQLRSRHYVHFSSFVVRVPRPLQETIACAGFWPMGVVFRRFRGNLPNSTPDLMAKRSHTVSSPK
jgi:hypothetical protein